MTVFRLFVFTFGAEASLFTDERDQMFMMAFGALHPQETMLQSAIPGVFCKFLLNIYGQGFTLCRHDISELRVEPLSNLVKK